MLKEAIQTFTKLPCIWPTAANINSGGDWWHLWVVSGEIKHKGSSLWNYWSTDGQANQTHISPFSKDYSSASPLSCHWVLFNASTVFICKDHKLTVKHGHYCSQRSGGCFYCRRENNCDASKAVTANQDHSSSPVQPTGRQKTDKQFSAVVLSELIRLKVWFTTKYLVLYSQDQLCCSDCELTFSIQAY